MRNHIKCVSGTLTRQLCVRYHLTSSAHSMHNHLKYICSIFSLQYICSTKPGKRRLFPLTRHTVHDHVKCAYCTCHTKSTRDTWCILNSIAHLILPSEVKSISVVRKWRVTKSEAPRVANYEETSCYQLVKTEKSIITITISWTY